MISFDSSDIFLVTGSSSGIGRAVTHKLNQLGAFVIASGRDKDRLRYTKFSSMYPDNIAVEAMDLVKNIENLDIWIKKLSKKYGKLRGTILSAGIQQILPLRNIKNEDVRLMFESNFMCNLQICKGICNKLVHVKGKSTIVFLSSVASILGNSGLIPYSATKGAINAAVRAMAVEYAKTGLRVNAVLPGLVVTEMLEKWDHIYTKEYLSESERIYPLGLGKPEDVADLICFLVSDSARWITGQCYVIDGGISCL